MLSLFTTNINICHCICMQCTSTCTCTQMYMYSMYPLIMWTEIHRFLSGSYTCTCTHVLFNWHFPLSQITEAPLSAIPTCVAGSRDLVSPHEGHIIHVLTYKQRTFQGSCCDKHNTVYTHLILTPPKIHQTYMYIQCTWLYIPVHIIYSIFLLAHCPKTIGYYTHRYTCTCSNTAQHCLYIHIHVYTWSIATKQLWPSP